MRPIRLIGPMRTMRTITILRLLGLVLAIAVVGDALAQAFIHLRDLSHITHIAGIWMTLAQQLRDGVFYPPLEQDGYYAGTRYMPLFFVLVAGLSRITGDYLLAAKLASLLSMLGVLAAVFAAARRRTTRSLDAFLCTAVVLVFPEGRQALLRPHADALAVAFTVAGLALLDGRARRPLVLAAAALLFALAMGTKVTSVAGCAAGCVFLFQHDRRSALWLAALTLGLAVVGFLLLQLGSDGRFLENFRAVGSGGFTLERIKDGPVRFTLALIVSTKQNYATALLLGPAVVALLLNARQRRFSLWDWYFLFVIGLTIVIFTSPGTDPNHLLELEVAGVLVLAGWLPHPAAESAPASEEWAARGLVVVALVFGLVYAGFIWKEGPSADAIPAATLTAALPDGPLLTEDATPAILLGRRPVVMDAFAYRLLVERGRLDPEPLAQRLERREFRALVLLRLLDDPHRQLMQDLHFGKRVTDAMRRSYRFKQQLGAYYLYEPNEDAPTR